jgi:hypothetical protein
VAKNLTFKQLQELWYRKLENTGFQDLEKNEFEFKKPYLSVIDKRVHGRWKEQLEYYLMAGKFLHDYKFKTTRERNIWTYHANGLTVKSIVELLGKVRIKTNRGRVQRTIYRLAKIMKKMYLYE